jgi:sugar O-acyltransferase (sialic acid O-acetyltransferase NeuD family)
MNEIIVAGGGGHAKVVIGILRKIPSFRLLGYTGLKDNGVILGAAYLGTDSSLDSLAKEHGNLQAALGLGQVGTGHQRRQLWTELVRRRLEFPPVVSPRAVLNEGVSVGEGCVVMDGAVVNSGATLGRGAIVNSNSTVEHDVAVGDWVHVAPGATVSGGTSVGNYSMVGAGATIIEGIKIAEGCLIGAGATVVADLPEPGVYAGCPARRIK